ncbi:MAG: AMIN domain-containing protein, partial [Myxococcota bacterium]
MKKFPFTLIFLLIGSGLYGQEPVNLLQKINVTNDSQGVVIGFDFNGPVSFTSMKLTDPYRILLDFTDCKKGSSIKNSIKVNSDGIKEISVSQMGHNDAPTLRVTIITTADLEFNIEPTDNGINVKIGGVK